MSESIKKISSKKVIFKNSNQSNKNTLALASIQNNENLQDSLSNIKSNNVSNNEINNEINKEHNENIKDSIKEHINESINETINESINESINENETNIKPIELQKVRSLNSNKSKGSIRIYNKNSNSKENIKNTISKNENKLEYLDNKPCSFLINKVYPNSLLIIKNIEYIIVNNEVVFSFNLFSDNMKSDNYYISYRIPNKEQKLLALIKKNKPSLLSRNINLHHIINPEKVIIFYVYDLHQEQYTKLVQEIVLDINQFFIL